MNTNNIKKYAPQARREFMEAVGKRLNQFGIYSKGNALNVSEPTFSGAVMQIDGNSFDAALLTGRKRLVVRAEQLGFTALVEQMAYTWFNRLCALRFMELKGDYLEHGLRVLSHPDKANSFEILDHAQDVAEALGLDRNHIIELKLAGNKDEELYRTLLLGQCHQLHQAMPFLFEALDDETELLLPDNLTRTDSILRGLVDDIPEEDWQQVEIIGWLYQFYISEKKDQVIGKVVKSEDIPAATQLFTPNWIVKYLVQNSVGRQWLMTYPDSALKAKMDYYITPAEQEAAVTGALAAITPTSIEPETIKILDPACGSGHILVEAYDILKAMYEERGYRSRDIPKLILENNLYGLDIDDRAAQLAGFALMMKAREDDRRIFTRDIKLNVLAIQSTQNLDLPDLWRKLALNQEAKRGSMASIFDDVQSNLADTVDDIEFKQLRAILVLFEQAKTLGSLIQVPHDQAEYLLKLTNRLRELSEHGDIMQKPTAMTLLPLVAQAHILAMKFDAVVANPPYMGGKGMNGALKDFAKKHFPDSKADLFAMFIERGFGWCKASGFNAQVTMQSWMFLSSYEAMREKLLSQKTLNTMAHLGARAFSEISGEVVQTTAFVFHGNYFSGYKPAFFRLVDGNEEQKQTALLSGQNRFDKTVQEDFKKISGSPVAYWVSDKVRNIFTTSSKLEDLAKPRQGMASSDDKRFVRIWHEVPFSKIGLNAKNAVDANNSNKKWFPYDKGGNYRKWYGNNEFLVNWENNGKDLLDYAASLYGSPTRTIKSISMYFKEGITWTAITSGKLSVRFSPQGHIFSNAGMKLFNESSSDLFFNLAFLNSKVSEYLVGCLSQTLNFDQGIIAKLPIIKVNQFYNFSSQLIDIAKTDWDNYETSWDFTENPLIRQQQNVVGWVSDSVTQHTEAPNVGLRDKAANPTYASNSLDIVPTLQRGNAAGDAPASRNAGASPDEFPRQSVGTINVSNNLEHCFK
ncbi:MAG: BREX-1 system adenine-specific DNA-methyltransferase PglX, partial [Methylovulum sp.]|nr:BREX-1 system adenine-specific DNA-methyltransferase PglX [Methylovulum sp.]